MPPWGPFFICERCFVFAAMIDPPGLPAQPFISERDFIVRPTVPTLCGSVHFGLIVRGPAVVGKARRWLASRSRGSPRRPRGPFAHTTPHALRLSFQKLHVRHDNLDLRA